MMKTFTLAPGRPYMFINRLWALVFATFCVLLVGGGAEAQPISPCGIGLAVTPVGPLSLCAGCSAMLTAQATSPGFNAGGAGFNNEVRALVVQSDGKVLVGGFITYFNVANAGPYLVRLHADGTIDAGFNAGGAGLNGTVQALAVQADGKILVGGSFTAYNGAAATPDHLLRLNADGTLDPGFNAAGIGFDGDVAAVAVQADGRILVGGSFSSYNSSPNSPSRLVRLNANGGLDATFNPGGAGFGGSYVLSVAVQADGKILAGGSFTAYNGAAAAPDHLLRLNADGTLDPGFNAAGTGFGSEVRSLALLPSGKVLAGGFFTSYNGAGAAPDYALRLNTDGSLDPAFNPGGTGFGSEVLAVAAQPDGQMLVGGLFTSYNGSAAAPDRLVRLDADGRLDASFNAAGTGFNSIVEALAVQSDGKVLVGGDFLSFNGNATVPHRLLRLTSTGTLNDAPAPAVGLRYTWSPGGSTGPTLTVSQAGTYTVTATTASGCTTTSAAVVVGTVLATAPARASQWRAYPNPAHKAVSVELAEAGAGLPATLTLFDALGHVVLTAPVPAGTLRYTLPLVALPPGVYFLQLYNASGVSTQRLLVD